MFGISYVYVDYFSYAHCCYFCVYRGKEFMVTVVVFVGCEG
jgi:hypothetical protein